MELQITGFCRFSYPSAQGSGFSHRSCDPASYLYQKERLKGRLALFETFCLPSIIAQKDPRFQLIILIGQNLPAFALNRLQALTAPLPNIILHQAPEGRDHRDLCAEVLQHYRSPRHQFAAEFNMDDDDALGQSFVARLHEHFPTLHPLITSQGHLEVDFSRGFAAKLQGNRLEVKHILAPHWALAQAFFFPSQSKLTIANFHHMRHWKRNACLTLNKEPMFLRLFHGANDSSTSWQKLQFAEKRQHEPATLENMQKAIPLDLAGWQLKAIEA